MTAESPSAESILIVEDETHIAEGLRFNLEAEGYDVHTVETGEQALDLLLNDPPRIFDVLVLDVMLPLKSGFTVVSELRKAGQFVPTLMLTARGRAEDILQGFEAGADDYLPKPFELSILIARIRGLLRRKHWLRSKPAPEPLAVPQVSAAPSLPPPKEAFVFGDKSVHYDLLELRVRERLYPITLMEATILRYLIEREGQTVSRKTMLQEVWGLHEDTDTRAIDNFMVRLRRYLEEDPGRPRHLLTVRGIGYRFVAFPPA
jgi:DNA-binding response OmpR family regulator